MHRLLIAATFLIAAASAPAQSANETCLACHDKVDASKFAASVHAPLSCTDCHADATTIPHEAKPGRVDCSSCHADAAAAWNNSLHAKGANVGGARCTDCHGPAHEIASSCDPKSRTHHANIPRTCSRCHAQKFVMEKAGLNAQSAISYQESVHGRA